MRNKLAMAPLHVDVAIIGAGTPCARVGCMPSKLLIAAAEVVHQARHADPFGIKVQGVTVDGAAVMARVQRERDRFVGFVLETIDAIAPADRLRATVKFQHAHPAAGVAGCTVYVAFRSD